MIFDDYDEFCGGNMSRICVGLIISFFFAAFSKTNYSFLYFQQRTLTNGPEKEKDGVIQNFKRTLSKKEKKKEKKREKEAFSRIPDGDEHELNREDG